MSQEAPTKQEMAEWDDTPFRCYAEKEVGPSSICRPAHRCDLTEGHEGMHVCDCGLRFRKSTNFMD